MTTRKKDSKQHKAFIKTARSLGCDESESAFNAKLKKLAKSKKKKNKETKNG